MILVVRDVRGQKLDKNVSKTMQALKPNYAFKKEELMMKKNSLLTPGTFPTVPPF